MSSTHCISSLTQSQALTTYVNNLDNLSKMLFEMSLLADNYVMLFLTIVAIAAAFVFYSKEQVGIVHLVCLNPNNDKDVSMSTAVR